METKILEGIEVFHCDRLHMWLQKSACIAYQDAIFVWKQAQDPRWKEVKMHPSCQGCDVGEVIKNDRN